MPTTTHALYRPRPKTGPAARRAVEHVFGQPINSTVVVRDRRGNAVDVELRDPAQHLGADHGFRTAPTISLVPFAIEEADRLTALSPAQKAEAAKRHHRPADVFYSALLAVYDPATKAVVEENYLTYADRRGAGRYKWSTLVKVPESQRRSRERKGTLLWEDRPGMGRRNPTPAPPHEAAVSRSDRTTARARPALGGRHRESTHSAGRALLALLGFVALAGLARRGQEAA